MRRLCLALLLAALLAPAGCKISSIEPMPDVMLSFGMLLKTEVVPLSGRVQLRRYDVYESSVSNDFYPLNLLGAKFSDHLVPKLFVLHGANWDFLDFSEMPQADVYDAPGVSPDGKKLIYERPNVAEAEKEIPRLYPHDRRIYRVAIYDIPLKRKFVLDCYTEVYTAGHASLWRKDGLLVAFTTTCVKETPFTRELVALDTAGVVVLDNSHMPGLTGLEFLCWSPDGKRIAALRPTEPSSGGRGGGVLVEVDTEAKVTRDVGEISSLAAYNRLWHMDRFAKWQSNGQLSLAK